MTLATDGIANIMKPVSDGNTHMHGNAHMQGNTHVHGNTHMHAADSAAAAYKRLATGMGELFVCCSQESRCPLKGDAL